VEIENDVGANAIVDQLHLDVFTEERTVSISSAEVPAGADRLGAALDAGTAADDALALVIEVADEVGAGVALALGFDAMSKCDPR